MILKPQALRMYLRLKGPAELNEVARLFQLLGLRRAFVSKMPAGHSAGYEGGKSEIELYAPTAGSDWVGPPGSTDFLIRVTDPEAAYRKIRRARLRITSDSKRPWPKNSIPPPPGVSRKEMEESRRRIVAGKRHFMVNAGGYNFFVC